MVREKKQNGIGIGKPGDEMFTLTKRDQHAVHLPIQEVSATILSGKNSTGGNRPPGMCGVDDVDALIPTVMAHGQGNAEHVSDGPPSLTCNHEAPILFSSKDMKPMWEHGRFLCEDCKTNFGVNDYDSNTVTCPKCGNTSIRTIKDFLQDGGAIDVVAIGFDSQQGGDTQQQETLDGTPPIRPKNRNAIAFPANMSGTQRATSEDVSPNLQSDNPTAIAFQPRMVRTTGGQPSEELNHALGASAGGGDSVRHVASNYGVRRLTPLECERLQGLPDFHTKEFSDSVRYRMIGNSVAVPVFEWVARRIRKALSQNENHNQPR